MQELELKVPESGSLFRCATHGTTFLITGITTLSQLSCEEGGVLSLTQENVTKMKGPAALGKRYTDPQSGVELLCIKPGGDEHLLTVSGREVWQMEPKVLPSAD